MTNHKETEMNAWKPTVLACTALALAAPAANAKFDVSSPSKALHAKVLKTKHVTPKIKTNTTPRVLIIVAPFAPTAQAPSADDSALYGDDCTDVAATPITDAATENQTATP
jgi:hypothetical protein